MSGFFLKENRIIKAKKIESVLQDSMQTDIKGLNILDIGCGSGAISGYFSENNNVYSVDVEKQIDSEFEDKINFFKVSGTKLPFENNFFDIVISNHVIEHLPAQKSHLKEIKRVLKPKGICYISTPNRLFIKEVHYKIYFLHYLPNKIFFKILNILGKFDEEIYLLNYFHFKKLLSSSGFNIKEYTIEILNNPKKYYLDETIPIKVPDFLACISKTNIFTLKKS